MSEGMMDALVDVYVSWTNYTQAKTVLDQAGYLDQLNNRMSDLFTHHPRFNYRTGEIDGVFDD